MTPRKIIKHVNYSMDKTEFAEFKKLKCHLEIASGPLSDTAAIRRAVSLLKKISKA